MRMIEDEKDHLAWVADWLHTQQAALACLRGYEERDCAVFHRLLPYEKRLWAIPGLGRESMIETAIIS